MIFSVVRLPAWLLTALFLMLFVDQSRAATITLQQGANGYSGCSDSFIASGGYSADLSQNFGSCLEMRTWCTHYASW